MTTAEPTIREAMKTPMIPPVYAEDAEDRNKTRKKRTGFKRKNRVGQQVYQHSSRGANTS